MRPPTLREAIDEATERRLKEALANNQNNRLATARELGVSERHIYNLINQFDPKKQGRT